MDMPEINPKSTKAEIIKAFEDAKARFKQLEKEKINQARDQVAAKKEEEILKKTEQADPDNLENNIIELRKKIQKRLDEIAGQLAAEGENLMDLRAAAKIEKKKLEEIYNIQLAADSLKILINEYESKEKELKERHASEEAALKNEIASKKQEWEREQDEYIYNLKLDRHRESETYNSEQAKKKKEWQDFVDEKEAELKSREDFLAKQEAEIIEMRRQIEKFPAKLEKETAEAKQKTEEYLHHEFAHEKRLLEQSWLAEKGIFEVRIKSLQNTIDGQNSEIRSLKENLKDSNERAQNLAVTVVEGASRVKIAEEKRRQEEEVQKREKNV
jgi:hypothetical protein